MDEAMPELTDDQFVRYLGKLGPHTELTTPEQARLSRMTNDANAVEWDKLNELVTRKQFITPQTANSVSVMPRQAGKASAHLKANAGLHQPTAVAKYPPTGPLPQPFSPAGLGTGDVIRWVAFGRGRQSGTEFTYAAVYAYDHWFITGQGLWYGTNKLTNQQMNEVLMRNEVITIDFCHEWLPAHSALSKA